MLSPTFRLSESQLADVALACEIGRSKLEKLAAELSRQRPTIPRKKIESIFEQELDREKVDALSRLVFGIAGTFRRASLSAKEALDFIATIVKTQEDQDERLKAWDGCRVGLEKLLNTQSVFLAAKAIDISYDFERVYITGRLLTSVRPVFDDLRAEIVGSAIVQTLRIEFVASNGDQSSISIAMDASDINQLTKECEINQLTKECERAVLKAEKAKSEMESKFRQDALITGKD